MTGSVALDIVIGLIFIYLLYSLLATIIQEILAANILNLRANTLEKAIQRMLDIDEKNSDLSKKFYASSLIKSMVEKAKKKPSYLTANNFSKVLIDILIGGNTKPGEDFREKIDKKLYSETEKVDSNNNYSFLGSLWADAQGDLEKFKQILEQWFDDVMDRATGWYKKKIQWILLIIGFSLAFIFNIDSIKIAGKLAKDPTLRAQIIEQAENFRKTHPNLEKDLKAGMPYIDSLSNESKGDSIFTERTKDQLYKTFVDSNSVHKKYYDSLVARADSLLKGDIKRVNELLGSGIMNYSLRGNNKCEKFGYLMLSILGWLITALAISLGAPFWFDLLNKLMQLRSSINPVEDESSLNKNKSPDKSRPKYLKG